MRVFPRALSAAEVAAFTATNFGAVVWVPTNLTVQVLTPVEIVGSDGTHVGRIRIDVAVEHGLACWVAFDSVRKGAALNAVEIAEILVRNLC